MTMPDDDTVAALKLACQAATQLDTIGDHASALRLRHAIAIIRHDAGYPASRGLAVPLQLMKMALALLDREGSRPAGNAASYLQFAIDWARGAEFPREHSSSSH